VKPRKRVLPGLFFDPAIAFCSKVFLAWISRPDYIKCKEIKGFGRESAEGLFGWSGRHSVNLNRLLEARMDAAGKPQKSTDSIAGFLLRLYWLFAGNAVLIIGALGIALNKYYNSIAINCIYFAVLLTIIFARYFDIKRYNGTTTEGEPATLNTWKLYSLKAVLAFLIVWAAAQALGRFVF
jgi:hypothetical protein